MEVLLLLGLLVILILLGAPIGFVLLALPAAYCLYTGDIPLVLIPNQMFEAISSVTLTAIPLFMLTGELMTSATITDRLVAFAKRLVGRLPGRMAQVNVLVSMFFAGMNGSVVADSATVGSLIIPAMRRAGYPAAFSAAITAVSGTIGGIIPPSIVMVILANSGGISVGGLFMGGIVPGILIGITLMVLNHVIAIRYGYERDGEPVTARGIAQGARGAAIAFLIPIVLVASVVGGVASIVEAGAITAAAALLIGIFIYRSINWQTGFNAFVRAFKTSAGVFIIIAAAGPFSWLLATLGALDALEAWLLSFADTPLLFAVVLVLFIFGLGMIMDAAANIIVVGPVLISVCVSTGFPEIQAALVVAVGFLIGTVTPPLGQAYFITSAIAGARLEKVALAMLPYLAALFMLLFLLVWMPGLTMFLPRITGFAV